MMCASSAWSCGPHSRGPGCRAREAPPDPGGRRPGPGAPRMRRCGIAVLLASLLAAPLGAEAPPLFPADAPCPEPAARDPYRAGACSVQLLAGYFPMSDWGPVGPKVDYVPFSLRA